MSYTEEQTNEMVARYTAEPSRATVDSIAESVGKSARSVIAKLAAAGVYQTPIRTTKTGDSIVKKEELVADINRWLGINLETLAKTGKLDLLTLHKAIQEIAGDDI